MCVNIINPIGFGGEGAAAAAAAAHVEKYHLKRPASIELVIERHPIRHRRDPHTHILKKTRAGTRTRTCPTDLSPYLYGRPAVNRHRQSINSCFAWLLHFGAPARLCQNDDPVDFRARPTDAGDCRASTVRFAVHINVVLCALCAYIRAGKIGKTGEVAVNEREEGWGGGDASK